MAQLSSPGVSVTVIDESFYTPAAAGTVPLIIVASEEAKQNGSGSGTAPGTLKANAGKVYLLTSQKDLSDTFGIPKFLTDANNNPIHAGEQNEYGLEAAYSFLGVSNRAYVVRADLDLAQLTAKADSPTGSPVDGKFWFDTADTKFGVFEWDSNPATTTGGQSFKVKKVTVITDNAKVDPSSKAPLASVGAIGDYAVVAVTTLNKLWLKKYQTNTAAGTWVEVGTPSWAASWPAAAGTASNPTLLNTDTFVVNGYSLTTGFTSLSGLVSALGSHVTGVTAAVINNKLYLYSTGVDITLSGTAVAKVGLTSTTYQAPRLQLSPHYTVPTYKITDNSGTANGAPTGSIWVKTTSPNLGADWAIKKYNATSGTWLTQSVKLFANNTSALAGLDANGGGINLAIGTVYVKYNDDEGTPAQANFKIYGRSGVGATVITSSPVGGGTFTAGTTNTFTIKESLVGSGSLSAGTVVSFTAAGNAGDADAFLTAFTAALPNSNLVATKTTTNQIVISHQAGGDFTFLDQANYPISKIFSVSTTTNFDIDPVGTAHSYVASLWTATVGSLSFAEASAEPPTKIPADQTLWYNSIVDEVDIMVHDGEGWVGYLNYNQHQAGGTTTDPAGPIVSATEPTAQSDGTALANGDLWISTAELEKYPQIYKYNYLTKKWVLVDNADQTSENGILFHDARWTTGPGLDTEGADASSIADLLESDFLDFDAPDPALYPKGMLLWNLRRSGFNVKKFVQNYVDTTARNHRQADEQMTDYYPHRWVSSAANQEDGSGTFGRHAQRKVVLTALQATINGNQEIRDEESRVFNLIACPGYPETIGELVGLNTDRGMTAFIVGDTPARLTPDATTLSNWGNNVAGALEDNDQGLVTTNPYLGVFYPWGYTSD